VTQNVSFFARPFGGFLSYFTHGRDCTYSPDFIDVTWYTDALRIFAKNPAQERPEENKSLSVLEAAVSGKQPVIFETTDEQNILRAAKIAKEFSLSFWIRGNGYEYQRRRCKRNEGTDYSSR